MVSYHYTVLFLYLIKGTTKLLIQAYEWLDC